MRRARTWSLRASGTTTTNWTHPPPTTTRAHRPLHTGAARRPLPRVNVVVNEPSTYKEASSILERQLAMCELAALDRTGTWVFVPLPSHAVPITSKWVFKIKTRSDGSIERYKARLVAKGFQQTQRLDYDGTFAPIAHMTIVSTLIAVAVTSWTISQMDVKNAFSSW